MIMEMIITLQIIGIQIMTMDHNTLKFTSAINTPSYMHDKDPSAFGFASDEARDEWYAAASKVIASFDILEDSGYNVENSAENVLTYIPIQQQISGVILKK